MSGNSERELIQQALPGYEIGEELGRGAWGVVLGGVHRRLGRQVAIKQLPRSFASDEGVAGRFLREAQMAASLDHPHIVPVYDYVDTDGLALIVMERCDGTVGGRFQKDGLHADEACYAALATCSGLAYAHGRGVLHRDVKPENLLIDGNGVVKVGDFGIARAVDEATRLTATGTVIGTPAYMSPEQASGQDLTSASDVYSIGVVLYEMLSGELPFEDVSSFGALIRQHLLEPPRPLTSVSPDVPAEIAVVVDRALAKSTDERWDGVTSFGVALGEASTRAFGAGWPRRRRFSLLGAPEIVAATEREVAGGTVNRTVAVPNGQRPTPDGAANPATPPSGAPAPAVPPARQTVGTQSSAASFPTPSAAPAAAPAPAARSGAAPVMPAAPGGPVWSGPVESPAPGAPLPKAAPKGFTAAPGAPASSPPQQWAPPGHSATVAPSAHPGGGPPSARPPTSNGASGGSGKTFLIVGGLVLAVVFLLGLLGLLVGDDDGDDVATDGTTTETTATDAADTTATVTDDPPPTVAPGAGEPLALGTLASTEFASNEDLRTAMDLAVREVQQAGTVAGQDLIVNQNTYSDSDTLEFAASALADDGTTVIVGATSASEAGDLAAAMTGQGVGVVSPTDIFGAENNSGLYYTTAIQNLLTGEAAASLVSDDANTVAFLVADNFLAEDAVSARVTDALERRGVAVVVIETVEDDPALSISRAVATNPDAVVVYGFIRVGPIYAALDEAGIGPAAQPVIVVDDDGIATSDATGVVSDGVVAVTPDLSLGRGLEVLFPNEADFFPGADDARAYDAVILVALAAEQAGSGDAASVMANLSLVSGGGQRCLRYSECKALIAEGVDIDYDGPGGTYDLTPATGSPNSGYFTVYTIDERGLTGDSRQMSFTSTY